MYYLKETPRGYAIYFKEEESNGREKYIADHLSKKQAQKWASRLNQAYDEGRASQW